MFVKIIEHFTRTNNLRYPHKGKVVSVDTEAEDTKKLGRIKCHIKGIFEESIEYLPWIYPQNPYGLGGRPDASGFSVPEIGSEVIIVFPFNDIYFPMYTGFWRSDLTNSLLWGDDYPNSYGFLDPLIQWLRINKGETPYIELFRELSSSSSKNNLIRMDEDGTVWINIPKNLVLNVEDLTEIKVKGDCKFLVESSLAIESQNEFSVKASSIRLGDALEVQNGKVILENATARNLNIAASGGYTWIAPPSGGGACTFSPGGVVPLSPNAAPDVTLDEISTLEDKLTELKQLAQSIHDDADAKLAEIAKIGD